jgi:hypothetical protein
MGIRKGRRTDPGQRNEYDRRLEDDGTYTISHPFTGETAEIGPWKMKGLKPKYAARALRILNTPS